MADTTTVAARRIILNCSPQYMNHIAAASQCIDGKMVAKPFGEASEPPLCLDLEPSDGCGCEPLKE